jgi:hypothetical protein
MEVTLPAMDLKLFVDTLLTGTPLAILIAIVGIVWQSIYVRSRDKFHDEQARRELELEREKFAHEQEIEKLKFEYEQRRWLEKLARDITLRLVESRLDEYSQMWSYVQSVARHQLSTDSFTPETSKAVAQKVKSWRYAKGGLLAEETTRSAVYAFQTALWEYDGTNDAYQRVRSARRILRDSLRADIGLGEDKTGQTIYERTQKRQKIHEELKELQSRLGITADAG